MTVDQPRDAEGRFGEKSHSAPEVSLDTSARPFENASFLFPPAEWDGGVDEYIEYWKNVPVPDNVVQDVLAAYAARRDQWAEHTLDNWSRWFGNSKDSRLFLARKPKPTAEEIHAFHNENRQKKIAELDRTWPRRLPAYVAVQAARAGQMMTNFSPFFSEEDKKAVEGTPIIETQRGATRTVAEVWKHWRLGEIFPDAVYGQYTQQLEMRELRDELAALRRDLRAR